MNNKNITEFGITIRNIRKDKKLSVRKLAEASGVSHSYLSQIENGTRGIASPTIVRRLSNALQYEYSALMNVAGYAEVDEIDYPHREMRALNKIAEGFGMSVEGLTNKVLKENDYNGN